jgi:hypothetical protein
MSNVLASLNLKSNFYEFYWDVKTDIYLLEGKKQLTFKALTHLNFKFIFLFYFLKIIIVY